LDTVNKGLTNERNQSLMDATDLLIAVLEDAIKLLKESRDGQPTASRIDDAIRRGEAAIREARQAERENAVMIKPQPRGMRIDGWDV
jgi:hypothetical protein